MANQQINYRSELVKMLRHLRKIKPVYYELKRPNYRATYKCSNGMDAEAMYLREYNTVGELKEFLADIPDDVFLDISTEVDYGDSGDTILRFTYNKFWDDQTYYHSIKKHYISELAKEKAKYIPVPTEEEYHEMLAKIKRYNDAKVNYVSC